MGEDKCVLLYPEKLVVPYTAVENENSLQFPSSEPQRLVSSVLKGCQPAFGFCIWQRNANSMQMYLKVKLQILQEM